jgi:short-chain fatty acids transporter
MEKVMPDSFIFAALLTFIVFIMALVFAGAHPVPIVESWYKGFWAYLLFSMQMVVLLIFGYSLAITRLGIKAIEAVTGLGKTPAQTIAVVCGAAAILSQINWALGFIGGIFLCLGAARRVKGVHWPLLVASVYIGALSTDAFSISITEALLANNPGWGWAPDIVSTIEKEVGQKLLPMGFDKTIWAPASLACLFLTPILAVLLCYLMHPTPERTRTITPEALAKLAAESQFDLQKPKEMTLADKLNWSRTIWLLLCIMIFTAIVLWFRQKSFLQLDLNMFNFIFIGIAMLLHENLPFYESVKWLQVRLWDHHAVPLLCGHLRNYGVHGSAQDYCRLVRGHFHAPHLSVCDHAQLGDHQHVYPLLGGDLDGPGARDDPGGA